MISECKIVVSFALKQQVVEKIHREPISGDRAPFSEWRDMIDKLPVLYTPDDLRYARYVSRNTYK